MQKTNACGPRHYAASTHSHQSGNKHIAGIDAIRLVAAVLVMFFHFGFWAGAAADSAANRVSQGLVSFPALSGWTNFGWVGVQVFFVISGFVIAFSGERAANAFAFFVTRFIRLFPTALICSTITLLAAAAVHYMDYGELFMAYLRSILFMPFGEYIDGSYWTLSIEISFYALVFCLIAIGRFGWIRFLAIGIGLQSTVFWVMFAVAAQYPDSALFQQLRLLQDSRLMEVVLLHHGSFFALGIFLWAYLVKQKRRSHLYWMLLFTLTGCLQIYAVTLSFHYKFGMMQPVATPIVLWLLALAAIVASVIHNERLHRAPAWLIAGLRTMGLMTYPLYLLHQTAGLALMGGLVKIGIAPVAALFITIVTAFAAAWLVCAVLEPPLRSFSREILYRLEGRARPALGAIR